MAYHDTHATQASDLPHRILDRVRAAFGVVAKAMIAGSTAQRRLRLVERLNERSDDELAALGIRREDIVRRVFLDMRDI